MLSVPGRQARGEFLEGTPVDLALEGDHLTQRVPVTDPAPAIELRFTGQIHPHPLLVGDQAQEKPFLALLKPHPAKQLCFSQGYSSAHRA